MADQHPTDEFCKPHEYIVERNGTWFIMGVDGTLRVHPEEVPEVFREPAHKDTWLTLLRTIPLTALYYFTFPVSPIVMNLYYKYSNRQRDAQWEQWWEARNAWFAATYRDAGIYQQTAVWADDGANSWGSPSATKGR